MIIFTNICLGAFEKNNLKSWKILTNQIRTILNEKKSLSKKKTIIVTGSIVVISSLFVSKLLVGGDSASSNEEVKKYIKIDALSHSQVFIENKLTSPATAKFDSSTEGVR